MAPETWVQSRVESYQKLKKWYLMPLCLTLSIIRYRSRVKWSNPRKEVAPSPTPWCSSYRKGSLQVTLDQHHQLLLITTTNYVTALVWFGLVRFYGISTIVGYLKPNLFCTYILEIWFLNTTSTCKQLQSQQPDTKLSVCSLYIPPHDPINEKELLNNLIKQLSKSFILMGDFNSHNFIIWRSKTLNKRDQTLEKNHQ